MKVEGVLNEITGNSLKARSKEDSSIGLLIYASNEPKSVLARDLGDCRDNLRNSRSVFLIVKTEEKSNKKGCMHEHPFFEKIMNEAFLLRYATSLL